MKRRGFLVALASAGALVAADPERLLWTPGKKLISIPRSVPQPPLPQFQWTGRNNWDLVRELVTVSVRSRVVDDRGVCHKFGLAYKLPRRIIVDEPDTCARFARALIRAQNALEQEFHSKGYRPLYD